MRTLRIFAAAAFATVAFLGAAAQEKFNYTLPKTTLTLEVKAEQEVFTAGPYAAFAQKYLGLDVRQEDGASFRITDVRIESFTESDPDVSLEYVLPAKGAAECPQLLQLTSMGLVSTTEDSFTRKSNWRFPAQESADFTGMGLSSPYTSASATLFTSGGKAAVKQDMVVGKTLEQKAKEAADMILSLRKTRIQILTGDTDASYTGEAMQAAFAQIDRLEQEYMTLFTGASVKREQQMSFDIIPARDVKNQVYMAFRLSDTDGLAGPETLSGKPYFLEIVPQQQSADQQMPEKPRKGTQYITYRVPTICTVKLTDGLRVLLQIRVPIYQLGSDNLYPIINQQ